MPATANTAVQKHTPGPWRYGVRSDGTIWLSIGDPACGPHYQGDLVASEADARLITSAPEMVLHGGDLIASLDPSTLNPEQFNAWSSLSAALAKAAGAAS